MLIIAVAYGFPDACSLKNIVIEHMLDWNVKNLTAADFLGWCEQPGLLARLLSTDCAPRRQTR